MLNFLYTRLDFVFFVYSILIFLIAKYSFINSKLEKENKLWPFLMLFSIFYGLRISSDMASFGGYSTQMLSLVFTSFAFLSLIEYARSSTKLFCNSKYCKWLTLYLALAGLLIFILSGEKAFGCFVMFGVCLLGGVWASVVIFLEAKKRRCCLYGIAFFLCALSLTHFLRLTDSVYNIWYEKHNTGFILIFLGVFWSFGLLVVTNRYLNFNFSISGIKRRNYLRYSIVITLVCATWFVIERLYSDEQANLEQHLMQRAQTVAAAVNPARIEVFTFSASDETKPDFIRIKEQLTEVRRVNKDVRFIYLAGLREGQMVFYLDSEDKKSPDYSKPGDIWDDAPLSVKSTYLQGKSSIEKPYTDKWGTWVSAFIPIKNFKTHKTVAVLGMDIGIKTWGLSIMRSRLLGIGMCFSIFVCLLVFFIVYELSIISAEAIKKSESKFSVAFERSPVLTAISTLVDGRFMDVNETFCKTLGYSKKQDIIGKTSIELQIFKDYEERTQVTKNLKSDGFIDHFELQMRTKAGETIIGLYYGSVIEINGEKCLISVIEDITQRKKDQELILSSERKYRSVVDNIGIGISVLDKDMRVISVNNKMMEYFPKLDISNRPLCYATYNRPARTAPCTYCPVVKTFADGKVHTEITGTPSDGQIKHFKITASPIKDAKGDVISVIELTEDITEQMRMEYALKESEQRFRDIAISTSDLVWEFDAKGVYTYCSENSLKTIGYTPAEVEGMSFFQLIPEDRRESIAKGLAERMSKREPLVDYEQIFVKKDGTQITGLVNGIPIIDEQGALLGYRGVAKDITEKKKIEDYIRQLSLAVEQSPISIVIANTEGLIEYTNPKFTSLTGYTAEEAKGQNPRILKAGDMPSELYKTLWETIKAGYEWKGELHNKKKNGELYWESASISPIKDAAGNITHFLAVKEDITDRKKLEAALQKSQEALLRASKVKDEFLSITSHDLKSPLGIVKTSMSLLLDEEGVTTSVKEYAELSLRQANKGLKLISDLLDLKKLETGDVKLEPTRFHFSKLVEETLQDYSKSYEQAGVTLEAFSDDDYELDADYNKVGQLISNLLGNALKYTSRGGSVKINTSLIQRKDADQVLRDYLKVVIKDTGTGIPEEKMKKIFEKYEQANSADKKTGTGIGLAIAKYVCELHHGDIWVESKMGQGSSFIFLLPYSKGVHEVHYDESTSLPYKILVVDDMEDQRFMARALLRKGNFSCDEASNWKDALEKIRTNKFSLVILDVEMPEIDGYELLEIVRREKTAAELPVIMFSSKEIDSERCNKLGVACFIRKEQAVDSLIPLMRKTLGIV